MGIYNNIIQSEITIELISKNFDNIIINENNEESLKEDMCLKNNNEVITQNNIIKIEENHINEKLTKENKKTY